MNRSREKPEAQVKVINNHTVPMMKTTPNEEKKMKTNRFAQILGAIFVVAFLTITLTPNLGHAKTGVGTQITNTVTVSWTGGTTTATATLTVALQETAPLLSSPIDKTVGEGSPVTITYNLTSQANGNDNYTLSSSIGALATISTPATTVNGGTLTVDLGSSMALSTDIATTPGSTIITLPETAANAGFTNGELIVINGTGTAYAITAVSGSTITIAATPAINVADNINEQIPFTVTLTSGTLVDPATTATHVVTTKGEVTGNAALFDDDAVNVVVNESALTVNKTASDTSPKPGDTVTYTILIATEGAAVVNVQASDAVPEFTTLVGDAYLGTDFAQISKCTLTSIAGGVITPNVCGAPENISQATDDESATIGSGDAAGLTATSVIRFNIGNGNDGSSSTGGTVDTNEVFKIEYKVKID